MRNSIAEKRVFVMGLGRFGGGVGVTRWLCSQGAKVTVLDIAHPNDLRESIACLNMLDVEFRFGEHRDHWLSDCELLVVNPAVPKDSQFLSAARSRQIPLTTEINLFLERCPCPIVGITGSVGKSTTAAMTAAALGRDRPTHLGGNIGQSLLCDMEAGVIGPDHLVVLELSSFQLEWVPLVAISPHVALVTNLQANHLDRHGTMESYANAKKQIFRSQLPEDILLISLAEANLLPWLTQAPGRTQTFDPAGEPFELIVPGEHNQTNAQAAWAIARQFGISRETVAEALREFPGLPNRLALVCEREGVRFFDDSKATTPAGAVVALRSFDPGRIVAIVGGYDKQIPLGEMAAELARQCKAVVTTGAVGPALAEAVRSAAGAGNLPAVHECPAFDDAVRTAMTCAMTGDVVLLSPGCASYGQFKNYIERGTRFAELVTGRGG